MAAEIRYKAKPQIIVSEMDGELVALDSDQGVYFGIGGIGARVWEMLQAEPVTMDAIVQSICAEYEVDHATCDAEIGDFVRKLIDLGVAEVI